LKRYSILANGTPIEFDIVHRPAVKRRIHLEVDARGGLQVVAPRRMSKRAIQLSLQQMAPHVARFLVKARAHQREIPEYHYVNGELHYYMGQEFPLDLGKTPGKRARVEWAGSGIRMRLPQTGPEQVRVALARWYRRQAQEHFSERLQAWCRLAHWTGGRIPEMRLRLMKRTWGSCSSSGVITLNPHLVKAPARCIDYVIAHEVCHLRQHNHGKAFYALQEQLYPGWREAKACLGERGHVFLNA
jgi:predicted metal-dependent hydrolase